MPFDFHHRLISLLHGDLNPRRPSQRRSTFSLPRPSAPYVRLPSSTTAPDDDNRYVNHLDPGDGNHGSLSHFPSLPSPFLDGRFFFTVPPHTRTVIEVDPAEHVHFMLEERAGEDGNGLGAEDGALPGYGRLFIQMDELRMPTTIATIGPGSGSTGTGTNGSPREGGAVPGAAGGIGYSAPAWEEVARWVKFEEDVEPGSNRWSKPRVATLALHSLLELRSCILNGVLILDMEATHLGDIENQLIDSLLTANQITKELEEEVRSVLRAPHIPQYLKMSTFRATASKSHFPNISSFPILAGYHGKFPNSTINVPALATATPIGNGGETQTGVSNSTTVGNQSLTRSLHHSKTSPSPLSPSQSYAHNVGPAALAAAGNQQAVADDLPLKGNLHFMKKLPENAEAAHVLIGEAEFLTNPIIAFVRLRESAFLGDMTEVPIPSRFRIN